MRLKITLLALILSATAGISFSQQNLPHQMSAAEQLQMPSYLQSRSVQPASSTASVLPPSSPVRTIGEWEELQGLLIGWISYTSMLREIVRAAKQECRVYITATNAQNVINYLAAGGVDTVNVTILNTPFNSVWSRDYGPWSAYTNNVDTLITIDWIYNRPRPLDDAVPVDIANVLNTPLYQTTTAPYDLIHTGGNFMCDGFGTGFSSYLTLNENPNHTAAEIDTIMNKFMGINRYIKFPTLPYDAIHHIDMHMKLLNEETLVMGQYPLGIADGPQIEANLQYILANYNSKFGTPYKVIRIPMPPDNGAYPNTTGDYFTYTNSSFINKTLIVPVYNIPEDTIALNIYKQALPGYTVVGINSTASIGALGALHCITKELGTSDPLLISHQQLPDTYNTTTPYQVIAFMQHRTGIQASTLYYRTDTLLPYVSVPMNPLIGSPDYFVGTIPPQVAGTHVYYYIQAQAVSGKQQVRPLPAPVAYFHFDVLGATGLVNIPSADFRMDNIFPNPASAITCIPVYVPELMHLKITITDILGKTVSTIFDGTSIAGERKYFFDAAKFSTGVYTVKVYTEKRMFSQKVIVK